MATAVKLTTGRLTLRFRAVLMIAARGTIQGMADLGEQIARWQVGDRASRDEMPPAVYDGLRLPARI